MSATLLLRQLELLWRKLLQGIAVVPPAPRLPSDLLLEIFARTDPATLVRCAATSKDHLRRVADPAFLRRHRHLLRGRFVPSLLLGVHCVCLDDDEEDGRSDRLMVPPPSAAPAAALYAALGETMSKLGDWQCSPVESRGGLLFVRDWYTCSELAKGRVISSSNPEHHLSIPPADIKANSLVLLPDDGGGDEDDDDDGADICFRLLAVNLSAMAGGRLYAQIFKSRPGKWGWGRDIDVPYRGPPCEWYDSKAVVLRSGDGGGPVSHWLCKSAASYHVVSFDVDGTRVGVVELPPQCRNPGRTSDELLLAPSPDGRRLSLLVAEGLSINVWTQTADATTSSWARHQVIDVGGMAAKMSPWWPLPRQVDPGDRIKFERWFGERSGTAFLEINGCGHFAVNLATKGMELVKEFSETRAMWLLCGHEMDPIPLLRKLKPLLSCL
ncbi:hypothetical protein ACP70R_020775 [Stipagrostis hirtigluma subsp. patula]